MVSTGVVPYTASGPCNMKALTRSGLLTFSLFHFCFCGKTPQQKPLRRERVYFGSHFQDIVHHYRDVK